MIGHVGRIDNLRWVLVCPPGNPGNEFVAIPRSCHFIVWGPQALGALGIGRIVFNQKHVYFFNFVFLSRV